MNIQNILRLIQNLSPKYKWDSFELLKIEEAIEKYGKDQFDSALVIKDAQIINELEKIVKDRAWKLIFNHDNSDGFFCEIQKGYHAYDTEVADLKRSAKRETLREAMIAATAYLNSYSTRKS